MCAVLSLTIVYGLNVVYLGCQEDMTQDRTIRRVVAMRMRLHGQTYAYSQLGQRNLKSETWVT